MAKPLKITLAQLNPIVGDIEGNKRRVIEAWKDADGDLIIFPELFLSGYPPEDLVLKPFFIKKIEDAMAAILKESAKFKTAALIPCPWSRNDKVFNAAHLLDKGKIYATIFKHHLPNYSVFDESRTFTPGPLPDVIDFRGIKLGIMICEDMWYPDVAAHLKSKGANVLIVPNGSPFDANKRGARLNHARARVKETSLPLIYVNQIGGQDELVFDGSSFALNEKGEITLRLPSFEEAIETTPFPLNEYEGETEDENALESIYNALVLGLRDYVRKNNFPGVLLGLSGGIDSALTAVIAADAIGAKKVHCVMMPSKFTSKNSVEDSEILAKNLGIQLDSISIEKPVEAFNQIISLHVSPAKAGALKERSLLSQGKQEGVTFENVQPRARGLILMALSNATGKMVLSTGNKSEMAVGYATLYGDMCGGFNALKDIYKTQVYALARWRNRDGVIPERIFTKAPTAELKDNQTDQDTLPPYKDLDAILEGLIENEMAVDEIVKKGHKREMVLKVSKMLDAAEYKRRQAPPGIKITDRAFGRDRRYPITNHFPKIIEKEK